MLSFVWSKGAATFWLVALDAALVAVLFVGWGFVLYRWYGLPHIWALCGLIALAIAVAYMIGHIMGRRDMVRELASFRQKPEPTPEDIARRVGGVSPDHETPTDIVGGVSQRGKHFDIEV